eukprot:CAMPEP_0170636680 /NCGR_PEP_ID=MMETSP0224-20130122/37958_1 /TAXON_ID=285029 /ORGANISM="Togula jolla, Strain CCCM 725" /LENGTH=138 /DNA_ID=CAMNT_0010966411 /DNA_START=49 /DNA_END=462 /DNA_ORIENTATION=+
MASLGLVAYGSWKANQAFINAVQGPSVTAAGPALRGVARADGGEVNVVEQSSAVSVGLLGTTGVLAAAVMSQSKARRSRASARQAEAKSAAAKSAAAKPATPPPPPPFDPAKQMGVTDPLGFFDPLGFSKVGDEAGFR